MLPVVAEPVTRRPAERLVVRARVTVVNGATGLGRGDGAGPSAEVAARHAEHSRID
jgi:hypothetical protein